MIDLLIGIALGALGCYLVMRFRSETPAQQASQISFLINLETRIQKMVSDAFTEALAELIAAVKANVPPVADQAAIDAAVAAKDAEDVQALKDAAAAQTPAP